VAILLSAGYSREFLAKRVRTTAGQAGISGSDLKQIPLCVPPLPEQHRIVAEVERRLSLADKLDAVTADALKHAAALRQSILKRAFAGRLVPQDPDDEPASILLERIRAKRAAQAANGARPKKLIRRRKAQS
jgi:type I restriction enzyme S subunit